jgi:cysteinyl-tRNA synthetase
MPESFKIRSKEKYLESSKKLSLYNSLGSVKQEFIPLDKSSSQPEVKMYVCGLTPYDTAHMGHLVPALHFDVLRNYLEYRNLKVNFVQNVTDIDDKIIKRTLETGEDPLALTKRVTDLFYKQLDSANVRLPSKLVKVTESIPQIIKYIQELVDKGAAYPTDEGNVYFELGKKSDSEYGKLSNQRLSELKESGRVESEGDKRSPLDFALWKNDKSSSLSADSPWGKGRPGWHIECSVMIDYALGTPIDIHGGGLDLKFPHHENELVQSESHDGHDFAKVWLHSGLLTIDGTKMSKSLGNFLTIEDAFSKYGPELIRFIFLVHHYRSNVNLSDQIFLENINSLFDFYKCFEQYPAEAPKAESNSAETLIVNFEKSMDDDLNAPLAIVALRNALSEIRKLAVEPEKNKTEISNLSFSLKQCGHVLGLFHFTFEEFFSQALVFAGNIKKIPAPSVSELKALLEKRQASRDAKDFKASDSIRDELSKYGLEYLDSKQTGNLKNHLLNLRFKIL